MELNPASDELLSSVMRFLNIGRYDRHSLEEAVIDFVDTASHYIAYHGEVLLEVLADDDGSPAELDPLPPGWVLRAPGSYLQIVPRDDRQQLGRWFTRIPKDCIWRIGLPSGLGTARQHRRLLRRLEALSHPMPDFALQGLDLGRSNAYDFGAHRQACDRLMEKATKRWGTVLSLQRPVEGSTEYFYISRRLAFLRAQALLREHIIGELNEFLASRRLPQPIVVSGIPTASDIAATLNKLHSGDVTFAEALEAAKT